MTMHAADTALVREGLYGRPLQPGPGIVSRTVVGLLGLWPSQRGQAVVVAHELSDGEVLPFDSLRAIHTPGHGAGHLALLLPREGGVLFVGDAADNWLRLSLGSLHEDAAESRRSLGEAGRLERVLFQWRLACGLTCPGHGGNGSRHGVSARSQLTVIKAGQRFGVLCKPCKANGAPYRGPGGGVLRPRSAYPHGASAAFRELPWRLR